MAQVHYLTTDNNQSFEIADGGNLYFELKKHKIDLKHGCLAGVCGVCRIEILAGIENCTSMSAIERDTLQAIETEFINKAINHNFKMTRLACRLFIKGGSVTFSPCPY